MRASVLLFMGVLATLGLPGGLEDGKGDSLVRLETEQLSWCEGREATDEEVAGTLNADSVEYLGFGKYGEAERAAEIALDWGEKALGVDHPDTLTSLDNLAVSYLYQGRYEKAEPLFRRAL